MNNSLAAIVSCDEASEAFALGELRPLFSELPAIRWLDSGLALVETGWEHGEFAAELGKAAPVFIRHIAPVQSRFKLDGTTTDIDILQNEVRVFAKQINSSLRFAVQTRIIGVGKLPFRRVTVNETLSDLLTAMTGATLDTRAPDQVVSVLCTPDMGYIGVSLGYQNRSLWPGGAHRFQREDGQISRSEFKLLEAINVFGLGLPTDGTALDMGAAPGGWTRVLRDRGLNVIAVDPADLDLRLFNVTGVRHVRSTIQVYLAKAPKFEVIVNDMRMDASESVELMLRARPHLCDGGLAIVTLKLPEEPRAAQRNPETVRLALERLSAGYIIIGARQLYHNRCEVTVALRASM